jgi:hypothetical protein
MERFGAVAREADGSNVKIEVINVQDQAIGFAVTERGKDGINMRRITLQVDDRVNLEQIRDVLTTFLERTK